MPAKHYFYSLSIISKHSGKLCRIYCGICSSDEGPGSAITHVGNIITVQQMDEYLKSEGCLAEVKSREDLLAQMVAFNNVE